MIVYWLLFIEFFQIGLFAIGGGLVTIPFLFNLTEQYTWFSTKELVDMIAISQSTPGPVGINMATHAGFNAIGITGGILATLSLVLPSIIIIYFFAQILDKWSCNFHVQNILKNIRPAVLALILFASYDIATVSITNYKTSILLIILTITMHFFKKSPILYIIISAIAGIILQI